MDTPPPWTDIGKHDLLPQAAHDEIARFNFLANLNKFMANHVVGGNRVAYDKRVKPAFRSAHGRDPRDRREIRDAMRGDPYYQMWSCLRRNTMEMRQQAGRSLVLRQAEALRDRVRERNAQAPDSLKLDANLRVPRYQSAVDNHCMPGSYYAEYIEDDVSPAANYDAGMFVTTTGLFGRYLDGAGRGVASWLAKHRPNLEPRRILDLGCGVGHNTVPVAKAFPQAEVVAIDLAAPLLRYAHARARSLGAQNITFIQGNVEQLAFPDGHFDVVYSTMFLHETSYSAIHRILREARRVLAAGGVQLHLEQPPFAGMDIFEQFLRDWDCYYNNEPFWTTVHDLRMPDLLRKAGSAEAEVFETEIHAIVDDDLPKVAQEVEDFGRGGLWYACGADRRGS
ncbi:MAG TPA: class I SAM-dependent methyltransferase [Steroidobacteraceae bacterium]|nr:class I SAM-dependent methyltransferase [Steroidobacteraceae bacterium]